MANAGGRLAGTVLSGVMYQQWGLTGCLGASAAFAAAAAVLTVLLPRTSGTFELPEGADLGGE
jgi:predicted MFS family arabinose efflux permease